MKKKISLIFIILLICMAFLTVYADEEILVNLRKTGTYRSETLYENNTILANESADWTVTYNAGSEEIVACSASAFVDLESIGEYGASDWQFSDLHIGGAKGEISNNKSSCTVSFSYSFTAKRFVLDHWETRYISKTKKFMLTSEGEARSK